jgi:hypothetical protein
LSSPYQLFSSCLGNYKRVLSLFDYFQLCPFLIFSYYLHVTVYSFFKVNNLFIHLSMVRKSGRLLHFLDYNINMLFGIIRYEGLLFFAQFSYYENFSFLFQIFIFSSFYIYYMLYCVDHPVLSFGYVTCSCSGYSFDYTLRGNEGHNFWKSLWIEMQINYFSLPQCREWWF